MREAVDEEQRLARATPGNAERVWMLQRAAFAEYLGVQDPAPGILGASIAEVEQSLKTGGTYRPPAAPF